jgi:S1-C subfamily serine protease
MTAVLQQVSEALATTIATVSPSIVRVEARRHLPARGLVWSRDGIILTTHHVIEQDDNIRVGLHSGQTVAATLVGRDATTDWLLSRKRPQREHRRRAPGRYEGGRPSAPPPTRVSMRVCR